MVWSLHAAKRNGIRVDQDKLKAWTNWATDWQHLVASTSRATAVRAETLRGQSDTVAQLLLAKLANGSDVKQTEWSVEYVSELTSAQLEDGSWTPGGQLPSQKRPKRETQEVSTMWAMLALHASPIQHDSESAMQKKARTWLGDDTTGESTEWWATRLMCERRLGSADKADQVRAELLKRQRADGGWGWLCNDESDALGTGIALFALASDHLPATSQGIAGASQFLLDTQGADGSWSVRGTKQSRKDTVQPTATYWGTCWAVIGLCETLTPGYAK
jgi:squalene-hopene/tetraprenyl-beta-curcumene cyclase